MSNILFRLFSVCSILAALLAAQRAHPAYAASYVVNSLADNTTNDAFCTLREAILAANDAAANDCGAGSGGDDTITFSVSGTIVLGSTLPAIVSGQGKLTIDGGGGITVSGNNSVRVMVVNSGADLTLRNITIANGSIGGFGGGIYNNGGTLTVINSTFSANSASGPWGGGGGIYNASGGTLTVTNSTFSGNSASGPFGGGGIFNAGTLTVTNSTFSANSAGFGGGIYNGGTLTVTNSTFSNNSASGTGGGIFNDGGATLTLKNTIIANSTSGGDCINAGTVDTTNSINNLIKDTGANACGLTHGTNGNIIGSDPDLGALTGSPAYFPLLPGSPAIDKGDNATCAAAPVNNQSQNGVTRPQDGDGNNTAVCDIGSYERTLQPAAYVVNTLNDNVTAGDGQCSLREAILAANNDSAYNSLSGCGAASSLDDTITFSVSGTIVLGSTLPAIVSGQGTLTIDGGGSITVSGNNSVRVMVVNSGADLTLRNITIANGSSGGFGGGIYNNGGTLTVESSTFSANSAGFGGGIFNASGGTLTVTNSTFSNNSATLGGFGGGIFNAGTLTVTNSTFSGNSASGIGGGIFNDGGGTLTLKNTIIANSTSGGDCINAGTVTTDSINNLIEGTGGNACGLTNGTNGNIIGSDPNLGALTGSPAYYPLNVGSPAIDAGDNATCAAMPVNNQSQNGVTRPVDGDMNGVAVCDIGAYERPLVKVYLPLIAR
ncbi:beta strand repeat-containing protein [Roseiflexus castenholzii]|uniref:Polymorphic outer membrane protein n=1 Tax=Roseiflexus castenholzii (strain DSM 13941 / HLO8) TaxID=383372 RepID=A7NN06_ROSCS|nr:choice-of-anchor Q domain-containing protein [Roseiflexus castenholzii]ABU58935.1 polymorphic outer membrane protein [Roseiflexus castenholzii DSM 13941]